MQAILEQHTAIIDGRIITFRRGSRSMVATNENFDNATLWIRVCGLPMDYLDQDWALEALRHVGYVEQLDHDDQIYREEPEFRAKVRLDLSQTLVPGGYIPLGGSQAAWVYFRYEGVFKFCKNCGIVGHYTSNCLISEYRANRWLRSRLEGLEASGFRVLYGPPDLPFYSNMIEGSRDTFRNRNSRVNLLLLGLHVDFDPNPHPYFHGNGNGGNDNNDSHGRGRNGVLGGHGRGGFIATSSESEPDSGDRVSSFR